MAAGRTLVVNGSRAALPDFLAAYRKLLVVTVTADPDIIAERLKARGREDDAAISRRLARSRQEWVVDCPHQHVIDNSGALAIGGSDFVRLILATAKSGVAQTA